jgi:uncharacterized protein YraI
MASTIKSPAVLASILLVGLTIAACGVQQPTPAPITLTQTPIQSTPTSILPTPAPTPLPSTPTPVPPPTPTSLPPTSRPASAEVTAEALNLRAGPATTYSIVGGLKRGDSLTITGRSPDNSWIEVMTADGKKGWCSALDKYVRLDVALSEVAIAKIPPTPTAAPTLAPTPSPTVIAVATSTATTEISPTPTPTLEVSPTPTPTPTSEPEGAQYVLYFYFGAEGCPYSRRMAPKVQSFYEEYGVMALGPSMRPMGLAALIPPVQQPRRRFEVLGVPVSWWGGDPAVFRQDTGVTFPFVSDPGFSVDTSIIPVTGVYSKQTGTFRVTTIGDVSYSTLVSKATGITGGGSPEAAIGGG